MSHSSSPIVLRPLSSSTRHGLHGLLSRPGSRVGKARPQSSQSFGGRPLSRMNPRELLSLSHGRDNSNHQRQKERDPRDSRAPPGFRKPMLVNYLQAAENGVLAVLKHQLEVARDVTVDEQCEETDRTALMLACMNGHQHCVEYLVKRGANIHATTYVGTTAILAAAGVARNLEIVQYLLDKGADIESADHAFFTPLIATAEKGSIQVVQYLLDHGANVQAVSRYGFSSLNYAVANGHVEIAELLIERNADVQRKDGDGFTPLMRGTTNGYVHICEMLVDRRARVNDVDDIGGNTALHFATAYPQLTAYLLRNGAHHSVTNKNGDTPLMMAATRGDAASLKHLVAAGASIHYINNFDQSALSLAAINNRVQVFLHLLELGASEDVVDYDGSTIFMLAAGAGAVEVVAYLLRRSMPTRLKQSTRDAHSERRRSTTRRVDRVAITYYLQDKQALIETKNHRGDTALLLAAKNKQLEMIIYLGEEGANLEAQNHDGTTALMSAARNGDLDLVKYLCEVGVVDLDVVNNDGKTAAHLARNVDTANLLEYFKEAREMARVKPEFYVSTKVLNERGRLIKA